MFISNTNDVYKGNYSFRMNIMEEIFDIRNRITSYTCTRVLCMTQQNK